MRPLMSIDTVKKDPSGRRVLLAFLLAALLLVLIVFRPFASALFLAAVVATMLWPIHQRLTRLLWGRGGVSASILVVLVVVLVLGPLVTLFAFAVKETTDAVHFVSQTVRSQGAQGLIDALPESIQSYVLDALERLEVDSDELTKSVQRQATAAGGSAAKALGKVVSTTGTFLFQGTMMIIALFFFLTKKEAVLGWLDGVSPLRSGQTREVFAEFLRVCKSVIVSAVATALVQALVALLGYAISGVPYAFFFFCLTFITAFIPAVGAASTCLVAAGLLLVTGHPWAALFLAIYGVLVVGLVDNVLKPWLIKGGMRMDGVVVFFALLGGLAAFGAIGLLIGPLAVALFVALLRMYRRDYGVDSTMTT